MGSNYPYRGGKSFTHGSRRREKKEISADLGISVIDFAMLKLDDACLID
jgi:hypothetical protein